MMQSILETESERLVETDKELLELFRQGDEQAFTTLVERHASMVRSVCYRILKNANDTDDAFQATFFVLASRAKKVVWQDSIGGWLHQVARRVSLKLRSKLKQHRLAESTTGHDVQCSRGKMNQAAGISELSELLDIELARLPIRFREALLLTQVEGLSRAEAAARMGISVSAIKDRLERGRELLQKRLLQRGLTLSSMSLAAWLYPASVKAASIQSLVTSTGPMATSFAAGNLAASQFSTSALLAHGFLKALGLQKLAVMVVAFLALFTGGTVAMGFLQDNPSRFEKGIRGRIVRLDVDQTPSITLELEEYQTLLDLNISDSHKVWIAYEVSELSRLSLGQYVSVRLGSDHRTIDEIHAQGIVREGTIRAIGEHGRLVVESENEDTLSRSEIHTFELSPDAIVRLGGLPASRDDLEPGMSIPLEFGYKMEVVHAIETEVDRSAILEGELIAIDRQKQNVTIAYEDEEELLVERTFPIDANALLQMNGAPILITDLAVGIALKARLSSDRKTIRAILAEPFELDDDPPPQ
ncbi:RNA polymerase sigma factor [Pirellulaceae bacterium SH501]